MLVDLILQLLERGALLPIQGRCVHEPVTLVSIVKFEGGVGEDVGKASILATNVLRMHSDRAIVEDLVWLISAVEFCRSQAYDQCGDAEFRSAHHHEC